MSQAVPWLPDACLKSERAGMRLNETVADWSRRWLPRGRWQAIGQVDGAAGGMEDSGWSLLRTGERSTLEGKSAAVLRLAVAMLGEDARTVFSPRDHKFLRRLAGQAMDDLVGAVDQLLPGGDGPGRAWVGHPWSLSIGPSAEPLLQVSIARSDLCRLARLAYPRHSACPLEARGASVAEFDVPISVQLGTATMDVAQFEALEPGDVIVLDQPITAPATLQVAGRRSPLRCTLGQEDGAFVLQLAEPV
jgi:hypothetical protein